MVLSAGFAELEKQLDVSASINIAQVLGGAGIAVALVFVLYHLANGSKKGYTYLFAWLIGILFYITFIL